MADQLGEPAHRDRLQGQFHVQDVPIPVCQHLFLYLLHRILQTEYCGRHSGEISATGRRSTPGWVWGCRVPS